MPSFSNINSQIDLNQIGLAHVNISSLSLQATQSIRNSLFTRNLQPPPLFSSLSLRDFAVIDQPGLIEANEFLTEYSFIHNQFGPRGGYDTPTNVITIPNKAQVGLYIDSFTSKSYSPIEIITGVNAEGLLSTQFLDDSLLAQYGAIAYKSQFENRIAQELENNTLGRINLDATDPISFLNVLTGRESIIERNWRITQPKSTIGTGFDLVSRLTGVYVPLSIIPGDYFETKDYQKEKSGVGKIFSDVLNGLSTVLPLGAFSKPFETNNSSQLFIEYLGGGQKSVLFRSLSYNRYLPEYGNVGLTGPGKFAEDAVNFVKGAVGLNPPKGNSYIGSETSKPDYIQSPIDAVPTDSEGNKIKSPVYGPAEVAKEFDTVNNQTLWLDYNFALSPKGSPYIDTSSLAGGFTWVSSKTKDNIGKPQGKGGDIIPDKTENVKSDLSQNLSADKQFRNGSILDVTQKLMEATPKGGKRLEHVGNAINQISRVFNDGYKELTKGSRVKSFTTQNGVEVGKEYCRVWTKDVPYSQYNRLQKSIQNIRKESYSVLDSPQNLNIVPYGDDQGSTNINRNGVNGKGSVKKYMFSIENLAWRSSKGHGLTYDDLPVCERGPNGGRIMWFPPYDITVTDNNTAIWNTTDFLGRPEPIYTYINTIRTGTLSFKVVVDHPSILNVLVRKEWKNRTDDEVNQLVDSFFSGCKEYDIFDLARKYELFTIGELQTAIDLANSNEFTQTTDPQTMTEEIKRVTSVPQQTVQAPTTNFDVATYNRKSLYFPNDLPTSTSDDFESIKAGYYNQKQYYMNQFPDDSNEVTSLSGFFDQINTDYTTLYEFLDKLYDALNNNAGLFTIILNTTASSPHNKAYNLDLSQKRGEVIQQWILNYTKDGKTINDVSKNNLIIVISPLGENVAMPDGTSCDVDLQNQYKVYSVQASKCSQVNFQIKFEANPPATETKTTTINGTTTKIKVEVGNKRREIANKLLRGLISECSYFDMVKDQSEFVYNSIKEKLKFFHPAFHAITPEGLNSRLTFLQQCLRPGPTMPTINNNSNPGNVLQDAPNTVFGAPPICVLRFGDFYNTKIAIETMNFTYDENLMDLNPEGIGVQPMIATVTMGFKYIGGQGIKEPVEKLQNAVSFNFFANTEMYDDRATQTVFDTDPDEKDFLSKLYDKVESELANENLQGSYEPLQGGQPIGNNMIQLVTSSGTTGGSGTIQYNQLLDENLTVSGQRYFEGIISMLDSIYTTYNYGLLQYTLANPYRSFQEGNFRINNVDTSGKILGQLNKNISDQISTLGTTLKTAIENEQTSIQSNILTYNNFNSTKRKKLKKLLTDIVTDQVTGIIDLLNQEFNKINEIESQLISYSDRMNVVQTGHDLYKSNNTLIVMELSGISQTINTTLPPNSKDVLSHDWEIFTKFITNYTNSLQGISIFLNPDSPTNAGSVDFNNVTDIPQFEFIPGTQSTFNYNDITNNFNNFGLITIITTGVTIDTLYLEYILLSNIMVLSDELISVNEDVKSKKSSLLWDKLRAEFNGLIIPSLDHDWTITILDNENKYYTENLKKYKDYVSNKLVPLILYGTESRTLNYTTVETNNSDIWVNEYLLLSPEIGPTQGILIDSTKFNFKKIQ